MLVVEAVTWYTGDERKRGEVMKEITKKVKLMDRIYSPVKAAGSEPQRVRNYWLRDKRGNYSLIG